MRLAVGTFAAVTALVGGLLVTTVSTPTVALAAPPITGTLVVDEDFTGATVTDPAWVGLGTACLTGAHAASIPSPTISNCDAAQAGPVPAIGGAPNGYLQLTDTSAYAAGSLLYNRALPASAGISVTFEQYQYGGNFGGDGIGFYLIDGATNLTQIGGLGGSLGYTQRYGGSGIRGGYIGVGLDVFGNFYDDGEGKGRNCPAGQISPSMKTGGIAPNVVTLRGPGNGVDGYCYQGSTTDPASNPDKPISTLPGRLRAASGTIDPTPAKRLVNIQVTTGPTPRVIVQIDFTGTGTAWQEVLNLPAPANRPDSYKFGFTGTSGGVTDIHLVRNVEVRTIDALVGLQMTKQVDRTGTALPALITAGTQIPYQYVVTNASGGTVNTVAITDNKITSTITCDPTTLPTLPNPAASTICHGVYTVSPTDVSAGSVTNQATATALDSGSAMITSNPDTVTVPLASGLTLTKTVVTAAPYFVGQQVTYNFTVTNTGASIVSNIAVRDNRTAAGTVSCDSTNLTPGPGPGQTASCTLTTPLLASQLAADGSLKNTATATGQTPIGQQVTSNQAQATIQVGTDVRVTKSVDDASPLVGQQVTFTVSAVNDGPGAATNAIINDLLPTGLQLVSVASSVGAYDSATGNWTIPSLPVSPPAIPATLTVVAQVNTAGVVTNAASLTALQQPDTNPSNNTASVSLNPVVPTTDIAVQVEVDSPSVRVGQNTTFTISATNNGPQPATGVTIIDALPSRLQFVSTDGAYNPTTGLWTVGSLAVGATVSVKVTVLATAIGSFQNTAGLATVSPQDVNQSNDIASADLTVTAAMADLQLVKSIISDVGNVIVGDFVTYAATVTNAGPDTVPDVVVTETHVVGLTVQAGDFSATNPSQGAINPVDLLWSVGSLAPGESANIFVRVSVDTPGTKVNVVTVGSASTVDPNLSNNTDIASFSSGPAELDVEVVKTRVGAAEVALGQTVDFTVDVTNNGPVDATNITVFDPVPHGLSYLSSTPTVGTYSDATGVWSIASLVSGQTETLTLTLTAVNPGAVTNTASLQSLDQADINPANNTSNASVDVVVLADLAITKSVSPALAQPGNVVTYTVSVTNNGPNTAEGVQAVDPAIIEATITGATVSQGTFNDVARVWDIGTLASGDTATLTVTVLTTRAGTFQNTVVISQSSVPDPNLADNRSYAILKTPGADLRISASVDDNSPDLGQHITLTISARNLGPDEATTTVVNALLPAGLTHVSSIASTGTYSDATGVWTIGTLTVDEGTQTLTIIAEVAKAGTAVNVATISAAFPFDPDQSNNTASLTLRLGSQLAWTGVSALQPILAALILMGFGAFVVFLTGRRRRNT